MPRKSVQRTKSQKSGPKSSQKSILEIFGTQETVDDVSTKIEKNAALVTRYILMRGLPETPFHKKELLKIMLNGNKVFDKVITAAEAMLKEIYGYNLQICESTNSDRLYVINNNLPYKEIDKGDVVETNDALKILVMLVLTHIFMSNNQSTDSSLYGFLQSLDIEMDEVDGLFGNVKKYITTTMVKQKYLVMQSDQVSHKVYFEWGSKAEHTISKNSILNFVAEMYKQKPSAWSKQYKIVQEQIQSEKIGEGASKNDENEDSFVVDDEDDYSD